MLDQNPDAVKIVIKAFPSEDTQLSFKAAVAALAAKEQNQFWAFHDMLFANADVLDDRKIQSLAAELGLDMKKFNKDMQSPSIHGQINRDSGEALQAKVSRIPAVFVNGKTLPEPTLQNFQQMIDAALNKQAGSLSKDNQ